MHSYKPGLIGHSDYPWAVKKRSHGTAVRLPNIIRNCSCLRVPAPVSLSLCVSKYVEAGLPVKVHE